MTEGRSVWDTGPQYPETSSEQDGTTAPAADPPHDDTPETGSPVDIDNPPSTPVPAAPQTQPSARKGRQPGWWQRTVLGFPVWMLIAFAAVVVVVFVLVAMSGDPGTDSADRVQTTATAIATEPQPAATTTAGVAPTAAPATAAVPSTAAPSTVAPATLVPATTSAPISVAPSTVAPATVAPATVAPTAAPSTVQAAPTLPPDGPVVTIIGSVGPCNFGSECLLAGFALHNFNAQPTEFVCEFEDGSRYTFHFNRQEVERASATGDPTDSITIEVDGVRSAPFRHP